MYNTLRDELQTLIEQLIAWSVVELASAYYIGRGSNGLYAVEIIENGKKRIVLCHKNDLINHRNNVANLKVQSSRQISREGQVQQEAITLLIDTLEKKNRQEKLLNDRENSDKAKSKYIDNSTGTPLNPYDTDLETGLVMKMKDVIDNYNQVMEDLTKYETLKRAIQSAQ